jgi:toxin ParE1/3/4
VVIWTRPARADLRSIHDYIARDSAIYAKKVAQEIRRKGDCLDATPRIGKVVRELADDTVRELSIYSYRIIYQIKGERVLVLALVHKRRNVKAQDIPRKK